MGTGTGLGLSIVDRIVRGFSGHIELTSRPGRGARFAVYIPQYQTDDGRPACAAGAA